jgi:hypothetical protein
MPKIRKAPPPHVPAELHLNMIADATGALVILSVHDCQMS